MAAELSQGAQPSLDSDGMQPMKIAFGRYQKLLSPTEQAEFRDVTFDDVMLEVKNIEKQQNASSVTRKLGTRLQPFVTFIERYAMAVDTMVQAYPLPSALIWGIIRMLVVVCISNFMSSFTTGLTSA